MPANNYPISNVLQEVVDEPTQPWTNEEAIPISVSKPLNQPSLLASFSDNGNNTPLPQVFQLPSLGRLSGLILPYEPHFSLQYIRCP